MANINSTYRIQFNKDFTFKHLSGLIDYFKTLGINTIYASPIFAAIPGSTHGYDGTNPLQINPEIGTEAELLALHKKLKQNDMNWLQDIVPNHMAFHPDNIWLMDVLENWKASTYFDFFDLDFPTSMADKRLMVPFLGEPLTNEIDKGQVALKLNQDRLYLDQSGNLWPINEVSLQIVSKKLTSKAALQKLLNDTEERQKFEQLLAKTNANPAKIKAIADAQYYQLCPWQQTKEQLNYRRFFTVNALICLNMQHQKVFDQYHAYIFKLVEKDIFQGLRIDHIDGLADPKTYLERLRNAVGPNVYLTVEKILGANETIPANWPIDGNTGYDFLAMANNLFTNRKAEKALSNLYNDVTSKRPKVIVQIFDKKREILYSQMQGELDHLYEVLTTARFTALKGNEADEQDWKYIIGEFLVRCPVYRFYPDGYPLQAHDADEIEQVIKSIPVAKGQRTAKKAFKALLLGNQPQEEHQKIHAFLLRCMQFSGPLMAKGVEDTLMYTYNRFIGHTEVGDSLDVFGLSVDTFHQNMLHRFKNSPLSINATSTHDTKRGEDVRARLNLITDLPKEWENVAYQLYNHTLNDLENDVDLHRNDAYLIFQTLFGAIPYRYSTTDQLEERLSNFVEKALREAKKRSAWDEPNQQYEEKAKKLISTLASKNQPGFKILEKFVSRTADFAIINSLSQLLLKSTCPGIPDFYQGSELWDLSLVDPDNRRPVDFTIRKKWLKEITNIPEIPNLWAERKTGKIKLWLTHILLKTRNEHRELFEDGTYVPLQIRGKFRHHILAFLRQNGDERILSVLPLGLASITQNDNGFAGHDWKDTFIQLPERQPALGQSLLDGQSVKANASGRILINELFGSLPFALIHFASSKLTRGSGVLMHITSLPSRFGIGDLGPSAHQFVDFLSKAAQKYWQILPLNPTDAKSYHSPYAAFSAMAGNTLLISPEQLASKGLVAQEDLPTASGDQTSVDFGKAEKSKAALLEIAFKNWTEHQTPENKKAFSTFCTTQSYWLDDFALFTALRKKYNNEPWTSWPVGYRDRDQQQLSELAKDANKELELIKFEQFLFSEQWHLLKAYANRKGIQLIGDLPFYVAHNSADVWANRQFFELDEQGEMKTVAGVPPDVFSIDGQRWGMPIFNWKALEKDNFSWWSKRLNKNIELFDLVRLDHFRAFHSYWQSAAAHQTAKNGWWTPGPGKPFFDLILKQLGRMPLIAEDLGAEMDGPIQFRKKLGIPGMKVVLFAFGDDMAKSPHIPHQFTESNGVAYAGTHDNNTIKGWFDEELDAASKKRLSLYVSQNITNQNVHYVLMNLVLSTTAAIAIVQMQDLLGLGAVARMNTPGTDSGNWTWKMESGEIDEAMITWLKETTLRYGRK